GHLRYGSRGQAVLDVWGSAVGAAAPDPGRRQRVPEQLVSQARLHQEGHDYEGRAAGQGSGEEEVGRTGQARWRMTFMTTLRRLVSAAALSLTAVPLLVSAVSLQEQGDGQIPAMINESKDPLLRSFRFRSIGPASMGGRIDDIAVSESDPNVIYIGYAVGGVFKSENNGVSFEPVFETYGTASIGDIAIHPRDPNIVYVGTGEANNRQTSSFGDGIYKTTDGGKTFTNIGLKETQTIARIRMNPKS